MEKSLRNIIEEVLKSNDISDVELLGQIQSILNDYRLYKSGEDVKIKHISDVLADEIEALENIATAPRTISTGFNSFDNAFGGFFKGEYVVIAGRPSMGKTMLLTNIAKTISKTRTCLYFAYDTNPGTVVSKMLSLLTGINSYELISKKIKDHDWQALESNIGELEKNKLYITDNFRTSVSSLYDYCKRYKEEHNLELVFIDFIQAMGSHRGRNRDAELSYISRNLKRMAKELDICIVVSSQLNRSVETRSGDKRPVLSDLRESGALEQDSDKVVMIHRPEYYGITYDYEGNSTVGIMELIVAKNKNGITGSVFLQRKGNTYLLEDFQEDKTEFCFTEEQIEILKDKTNKDDENPPF